METVHVLHVGCVSSVFLASKQPGSLDQDQKVVKAYHKPHLQVRHWLNITREVTHLKQLKDIGIPGIVDLCGTADDASNIYLVFEPCFGGDLYKRLAHRGLYEEAQLCKEVVTPLLKVLHSLHQLGIIHRDIKPENIFFESDGTLRLGDFGLAINAARERPISRVGTLDYMAPEVLAQPSADVIAARKIKATQLPSYDCKVDIWAVGVLMYEALMGVTPFNDVDPQAACLKAQFRAPLSLPSVSAACADFVTQALSKQAAKRPNAAQLLAHPWIQAHMTSQEVQAFVYTDQALAQRMGSGGSLTSTCLGHHFTPRNSGCAAPAPLSINVAALALKSSGSSSSNWELSSSAPTASPSVLSAASSTGLPWQAQASTGCVAAKPQASPVAPPKPQPQTAKPQPPPPHPFAAAAVQFGTAKMFLGPLPQSTTADGSVPDTGCSLVLPPASLPGQPTAPLQIQQLSAKIGTSTRKFSRQLSSPARLRHPQVLLDEAAQPGEPPASPSPANSGRLPLDKIALAMSPMRALLGAGRNLVRSRSGAAAPAADGSVAAPSNVAVAAAGKATASLRSPLPSPIRGLLQSGRRKPAHASSASSLFAAAQWKPGAGNDATTCTSTGSAGDNCASSSGAGCSSGSGCGGAPKGIDSASFMRTCSMGPNTVLGAGLCSQSSNTAIADAGVADSSACSGSSGATHAAVAVAAAGLHAKRLPALPCGSGSEEQAAAGRKQQLALLNRYPSAPDPGPFLALSPVRSAAKGAGMCPAPIPIDRAGSQGMRGVWLKMQGVARMMTKQNNKETSVAEPQDAHCMVSRSP